jgi:hypothetical protein
MHRPADPLADGHGNQQPAKRKDNSQIKTVFMSIEPHPIPAQDLDLVTDAVGSGFRFEIAKPHNAYWHQNKPNTGHQNGMVIPVNLNGSTQKFEINFGWNM